MELQLLVLSEQSLRTVSEILKRKVIAGHRSNRNRRKNDGNHKREAINVGECIARDSPGNAFPVIPDWPITTE